jgi:hypothetical protein
MAIGRDWRLAGAPSNFVANTASFAVGGTLTANGVATFTNTVTMNSTLTVTNAINANFGQIAFPATQNPSSDANTLDDYEEGSWTPTLTFATPGTLSMVYGTRAGRYQKIGNKVRVWVDVRGAAGASIGTASGGLQITGLPFTAGTGMSSGGFYYGPGPGFSAFTLANYTQYNFRIPVSNTRIEIAASASAQSHAQITAAHVNSITGILIIGDATYEI